MKSFVKCVLVGGISGVNREARATGFQDTTLQNTNVALDIYCINILAKPQYRYINRTELMNLPPESLHFCIYCVLN